MRSTQHLARVAGFLYVLMALIAPIGLVWKSIWLIAITLHRR